MPGDKKQRFRPSRSPVLPAISRKLANTIVSASTIPCELARRRTEVAHEVCSATFNAVPSDPTMIRARQSTPRMT